MDKCGRQFVSTTELPLPTVSVGEFQKPTPAGGYWNTAALGRDSHHILCVIRTIDSRSLRCAIVRVQTLGTSQTGSLDFTFRFLHRDHIPQSHLISRP